MDDPVLRSYPNLDAGDDRPAHVRIEEWLERLINSGQLKVEDRLPSEVDMSGTVALSLKNGANRMSLSCTDSGGQTAIAVSITTL